MKNDNFIINFFKAVGAFALHVARLLSLALDRLIFSKRFALVASFIIALLMYFSVTLTNQQTISQRYSYEKKDVPLEVVIDKQQFAISNVPQTINVVATGSRIDIQAIESETQIKGVVDLTGLSPGVHTVPIGIVGLSENVSVFNSPQNVTVTIEAKVSRRFKVVAEYLNQSQMEPQYILQTPKLDLEEVEIKATTQQLDNISKVVALIDVANRTETFSEVVPIVAYDQEGKLMEEVIISPNELKTTINVSSPSRQVEIVVVPLGTIAQNKMIDSIELDEDTVTLYGQQDILNRTSQIEAIINANALTKDELQLKHTLVKPEGINAMSRDAVTINIKLAPKEKETIKNFAILIENNRHNYVVRSVDNQPLATTLEVYGTKNRLMALNRNEIRAAIDIDNLAPGHHLVPIKVFGHDPLIEVKTPEQIEIVITERGNN